MTDASPPSLGQRLRSLRKSQGLGLKAVAPQLGLSHQQLSNYERDVYSPSADTLRKLGKLYGVGEELVEMKYGPLDDRINRQARAFVRVVAALVNEEGLSPQGRAIFADVIADLDRIRHLDGSDADGDEPG